MSFLKEIPSLPLIRALTKDNEKGNNNFSVVCSSLFRGTLLGEYDVTEEQALADTQEFIDKLVALEIIDNV